MTLEECENQLRDAHQKEAHTLTFQDFVDRTRNSNHHLRQVAISYNHLVYEMQLRHR